MSSFIRFLTAVALTASLLTGPAFAQFSQGKERNPLAEEEENRRKQNAEVDKQYNAMRRHTQDGSVKSTKVDPWLNLRAPTDPAKR
jgi:hypothetical protein